MLPNVRLWVDHAHVRLICASIHQDPIIHLQEGIASIIGRVLTGCRAFRERYCIDLMRGMREGEELDISWCPELSSASL